MGNLCKLVIIYGLSFFRRSCEAAKLVPVPVPIPVPVRLGLKILIKLYYRAAAKREARSREAAKLSSILV